MRDTPESLAVSEFGRGRVESVAQRYIKLGRRRKFGGREAIGPAVISENGDRLEGVSYATRAVNNKSGPSRFHSASRS